MTLRVAFASSVLLGVVLVALPDGQEAVLAVWRGIEHAYTIVYVDAENFIRGCF